MALDANRDTIAQIQEMVDIAIDKGVFKNRQDLAERIGMSSSYLSKLLRRDLSQGVGRTSFYGVMSIVRSLGGKIVFPSNMDAVPSGSPTGGVDIRVSTLARYLRSKGNAVDSSIASIIEEKAAEFEKQL